MPGCLHCHSLRVVLSAAMFAQFKDECGNEYGSFEVFYIAWPGLTTESEECAPQGKGYYWQACFPGCLPDGEPNGPFETEQDAIKDATDYI